MSSLSQSTVSRPVRRFFFKLFGPTLYEKFRYRYYTWFRPNAGYDRSYFAGIDAGNAPSQQLLAQTLWQVFRPAKVLDVGCGSGGIGQALLARGVAQVHGFDFSSDSVELARERGLTSATRLDLTKVDKIPACGDVCICLEVAEHVPPQFSLDLCKLLAATAPIVVFTAAPPGQGGHLHINLKPREEWIRLFSACGMNHDVAAETEMRRLYGGKMISDYDVNLMVFRCVERSPAPTA